MRVARIASIGVSFLGSLGVSLLGLLGAAPSVRGTFALQNAHAQTQGHFSAQPIEGSPLERNLDFWLTSSPSGATLERYDVDMTKLLHVIIVSDDFSTFLHVHPVFSKDGHFRIRQRFPKAALYHVYADGEPHGVGQQVFRFDVPVGNDPQRERRLVASGARANAGPYTVAMDRTSLAANGETMVTVHILQAGKPAADLHPYLGALAHAVFINDRDLTYVHVHPVPFGASGSSDMSAMPGMNASAAPLADTATSSPDMMLHVAVHEPGTYKLWLQFRGGDTLRVAPFVVTAT